MSDCRWLKALYTGSRSNPHVRWVGTAPQEHLRHLVSARRGRVPQREPLRKSSPTGLAGTDALVRVEAEIEQQREHLRAIVAHRDRQQAAGIPSIGFMSVPRRGARAASPHQPNATAGAGVTAAPRRAAAPRRRRSRPSRTMPPCRAAYGRSCRRVRVGAALEQPGHHRGGAIRLQAMCSGVQPSRSEPLPTTDRPPSWRWPAPPRPRRSFR